MNIHIILIYILKSQNFGYLWVMKSEVIFIFTSTFLYIFCCLQKAWNDLLLKGKKETFSHYHIYLKKSEGEKRNIIKEPTSHSSSTIYLFLLHLLSWAEAMSISGLWVWVPPPATTNVSLILSKPWPSLLHNDGSDSIYILRSPGRIMQIKLLAQGLAQKEDPTMLAVFFFHQSCLIWELLGLITHYNSQYTLSNSNLIYKTKVKGRAGTQTSSSPLNSWFLSWHPLVYSIWVNHFRETCSLSTNKLRPASSNKNCIIWMPRLHKTDNWKCGQEFSL